MVRLQVTLRLLAFIFICLSAATSLAQSQTQAAVAPQRSPHKQQGFFDYVLGKVNPNGNEYGASMQAGRDAVVANTVDDLYFWSNALTLLLLSGSVTIILLQWRSEAKREIVAAVLIAELWNGRVSDRIELERRTEQFNQLVAAHNTEIEKTLALKQQPSEQERQVTGNLNRGVRKLTENGAMTGQKGVPLEPTAAEIPVVVVPETNIAGLQQSNLLLQRRVEAMQNTEQNLKQRLNQTTALLEQERRRNATLKGA
jgi:hypothetical protein